MSNKFLKGILKPFNLSLKINDSFKVLYYVLMFLMLISPNFFVKAKFETFTYTILIYLVLAFIFDSFVKKKPKYDLSKGLPVYIILGLIFMFTFNLIINPSYTDSAFQFTSLFSKLSFVVIGIASSESFIRRGLKSLIGGSSIWTNIIMGLGHGLAYATLTNFVYGTDYFWMIGASILAFFIFEWVSHYFGLPAEAECHGLYNFQFY